PLQLKGLAFRHGKIAMPGPSAGERQPMHAAARASEESQRAHRELRRPAVEPRAARKDGPEAEAKALRSRRQMALELALAPMTHELGQRNAYRADFLAAPAERRGIRQVAGLVDADERRCQHRTHGTGIDPTVSMAANGTIDRAMI